MTTNKNTYVVIAVALSAILAAGGILASNMAFKLNYPLNKAGTAGSKSGTNTLSLPYFRQTGINDAFQLMQDIEGGGPPFSKVISISKFLEASDTLHVYNGRMATPQPLFSLVAGEGYRIQMSGNVNYIVVGSHDPALVLSLDAPGPGSKSGTNDVAFPYNISHATALDLFEEIEGRPMPFGDRKMISISKFLPGSDTLQTYTVKGSPGPNFNLIPGESYRIQMRVTVPYIASHY